MKNTLKDSEIPLTKLLDNSRADEGATALGPAVLASAILAGKGKPGSQVTICTDGMANTGLGSFGFGNQNNDEANKFY